MVGPSLFESWLFQLFRGGFYIAEKSLLHSAEPEQTVESLFESCLFQLFRGSFYVA
ncbi:hypothetical protein K443DRAFT_10473 [Laccaria amethystina LaAM-08-1]|uniref:Uncharacterized protein n=1 Tax=Laccaria amethystina LaAM-08-1 TaxID=1095629 RepID=A0A0C9WVV1_9AGAR|nr:hypothetical protein K443DRAFT_10473 [Laccaria amethystina LaAM-08-1]